MEYFGNLPKSKPAVRVPFETGRAAMDASKWDEAIVHFQEAMKHASGAEDRSLHYLVGRCRRTPAIQAQAMQSYEESARLAEQLGDKQLRANALNCIGGLLRDAGDFEKSLASHEQALKLAQEAKVRSEQAEALNAIGGGYHVLKDSPDKAFRYFQDALRIFEETGDRKGRPRCSRTSGWLRRTWTNWIREWATARSHSRLPAKSGITVWRRPPMLTSGGFGSRTTRTRRLATWKRRSGCSVRLGHGRE